MKKKGERSENQPKKLGFSLCYLRGTKEGRGGGEEGRKEGKEDGRGKADWMDRDCAGETTNHEERSVLPID